MGLGSIPYDDELFLGMLGMHGTYEANMAMHDCDVLMAIGARFDDRVTGKIAEFCPHAQIIHIDIDPSSISKTITVDVPIVGDVAGVLQEMNHAIKTSKKQPKKKDISAWWAVINGWRDQKCMAYDQNSDTIKPQRAVELVHEITQGNAYVTSDVGQHQMWAAQYYGFKEPNRWINSGGLGTMGFGLPAAMGVQLAFPEETVVCITGEGSIQMCIQELSTCLQYGLPIKIIALNNRYLGMRTKRAVVMRHIISILIENEAGALSRVAGLFSARAYNIESLTVAPTEDPTLSRMTIVTIGTDRIVEQITKQLNKLIDVVKLLELTDGPHIEREMMLIKVKAATLGQREDVKRLSDIFRGHVIDVTPTTFTIELTGSADKLDSFIEALAEHKILETVRSGVSGIARGDKHLQV
ncbi:UNVERIFIED_CONTAM: hypothetical protein GTU68_058825 [Idotea baltica]|nr:hypothetical protein [Idotea baltica]